MVARRIFFVSSYLWKLAAGTFYALGAVDGGSIPPSPTIYAGVAQLVEQRFKGFLTTETYSRIHWLLTRGSQVRVLSPAQKCVCVADGMCYQ